MIDRWFNRLYELAEAMAIGAYKGVVIVVVFLCVAIMGLVVLSVVVEFLVGCLGGLLALWDKATGREPDDDDWRP